MNNSLLETLTTSGTSSLSTIDIVFGTCLPFILCFAVTYVYRLTQRHHNYSIDFVHSIFLFSSLTSMVTMIIGSNIARSFGLIGAMSIIRFRNALKSPMDAIYIFWALVIGMACGTGFYFAAILLTVICAIIVLLLNMVRYGETTHQDSVLKVFAAEDAKETPQAVEVLLGAQTRSFRRLNVLFNSEQKLKTYIYTLRASRKTDLPKLQQELATIPGVTKIHHLNTEATAFVQ